MAETKPKTDEEYKTYAQDLLAHAQEEHEIIGEITTFRKVFGKNLSRTYFWGVVAGAIAMFAFKAPVLTIIGGLAVTMAGTVIVLRYLEKSRHAAEDFSAEASIEKADAGIVGKGLCHLVSKEGETIKFNEQINFSPDESARILSNMLSVGLRSGDAADVFIYFSVVNVNGDEIYKALPTQDKQTIILGFESNNAHEFEPFRLKGSKNLGVIKKNIIRDTLDITASFLDETEIEQLRSRLEDILETGEAELVPPTATEHSTVKHVENLRAEREDSRQGDKQNPEGRHT